MRLPTWLVLSACLPLTACSGVFESDLAAPQSYVLRLPPAPAPEPSNDAGSVLCAAARRESRPRVGAHRAAAQ